MDSKPRKMFKQESCRDQQSFGYFIKDSYSRLHFHIAQLTLFTTGGREELGEGTNISIQNDCFQCSVTPHRFYCGVSVKVSTHTVRIDNLATG